MKKDKRKYPTYNEARLLKIKEQKENKKILEEYEIRITIKEQKLNAENFAKQQGLNAADVLNSMGFYRYDFINYEGKLIV